MAETRTSYGLAIDFTRCAWDLRDYLHDRGLQVVRLTDLVGAAVPEGAGSYFQNCCRAAKVLGCKASRFVEDLIDEAKDDVLCMGYWKGPSNVSMHVVFSYEESQDPSRELLDYLSRVVTSIAKSVANTLTLEGLSASSDVSAVLGQLFSHFDEDWGKVARALCESGHMEVEIASVGGVPGHAIRRISLDDAPEKGEDHPQSSEAASVTAFAGKPIEDVVIPGYPPHAFVSKSAAVAKRCVAALRERVWIGEWPRRCEELRNLTGHAGTDDDAWLALVAKQFVTARVVEPSGSLPGYAELATLFDKGGRSLFALLKSPLDGSDIRLVLESFVDYEGASSNVALDVGARPKPDKTFHALDYLSYLEGRAKRATLKLAGGGLEEVARCVSEERAVPSKLLSGLADYGEAWAEIERVLVFLGKPDVTTLDQVGREVQEWQSLAVRVVSVRESLREVIEQCIERFCAVVPWGHPVMKTDLEELEGPDELDEDGVRELSRVYVALVEEMVRPDPYEARGRRLELVEEHLGTLGAVFPALQKAFAANSVDLSRLRASVEASLQRTGDALAGEKVEEAPDDGARASVEGVEKSEAAEQPQLEPSQSQPAESAAMDLTSLSVVMAPELDVALAIEDDDLLLDEVPSFCQEPESAQQPRALSSQALDELTAFLAPDEPEGESNDRAPVEEVVSDTTVDLCDSHGQEYRYGRSGGSPCDFDRLFELDKRGVWPKGEMREDMDAFSRCALMGKRGRGDVLECLEEALRDGVRPITAHRILDLCHAQAPSDSTEPVYQRYWTMATLSDRFGVAGGGVPAERLLEDLEWLLDADMASLDPDCVVLLAEAFLTAIMWRLSGDTIELYLSFLSALGQDVVRECGLNELEGGLRALLDQLREDAAYGYSDEADYASLVVPSLAKVHSAARRSELREKARERRDKTVSSSYVPAQTFWRETLTQPQQDSKTKVGPILSDLFAGASSSGIDADELRRLRRNVSDNLSADYSTLPCGSSTKPLEGPVRQNVISCIGEIYNLYGELLELGDADDGSPQFERTAQRLEDVRLVVFGALERSAKRARGGWESALEWVAGLQRDHSRQGALAEDAGSILVEDELPASLKTACGLGLVEVLLHAQAGREDHCVEEPSADWLGDRMAACHNALERAFTFNVVDAELHDLVTATLARIHGVIDSLEGASQGVRSTRALLARWTLDVIDARIDSLCGGMIARVSRELESSRDVDEQTRALLEGAVRQKDIARIFAYTDYEMDSALLSFAEQPTGFEDEFYGFDRSGKTRVGLIDELSRAMESEGGQFSYKNLSFAEPVLASVSPQGRAELGLRDFQGTNGMRKTIRSIKNLIKDHSLPIDGKTVLLAGDAVSGPAAATSDVSRLLAKLFSALGFEEAAVEAKVSHQADGSLATGWTLSFFARPSATDSRGELVCPLREYVMLSDSPDGVGPARVRYEISIFTDYELLSRAMAEELDAASMQRLALYLDVEGSGQLIPSRRYGLMPARMTPWSSKAPGMLLLDEILAAYLASVPCTVQANDRLSAFFRCALPFTASHPYGDDARKSVRQPPLFYGRSTILEQLRTGAGRTFIYGARRMGKTSILRELAAEERAKHYDPNRMPGAFACVAYVDMMGFMGIDLDNFWTQLVGRGFSGDLPELASARDAEQVQAILSAASSERSFYLLLDEADDLLRYDSFLSAQHPRNAIMNSLVSYMSRNERFRVIIGGLHATMRYAAAEARENRTSGQLASSVVVGPLWEGRAYEDAARLVYEPLKVMGYVIEPQDVLKILGKTCYFPNLINIVCEKLLSDLRRQRRTSGQPFAFVRIPSSSVDLALREATSELSEKFQLTIELDPGYDVVVSALMLLEAQGEETGAAEGTRASRRMFSVDEIAACVRRECEGLMGGASEGSSSLDESALWEGLEDDIEELVLFGILKKPDELVSLRDGSMRSLVGVRRGVESARIRLRSAYRSYFERDPMRGRLVEGERRNAIIADGLVLYSPLDARGVGALSRCLSERGYCVVASGCDAGSQVLTMHLRELLPSLCGDTAITSVSGEELGALLDAGAPEGLVVAGDGWRMGDLERVRTPAGREAGTRFILLASPHTTWNLREELADNEVARATPWSPWICRAWVKNYVERFERETGGIVQSRTQSSLARQLGIWCGGQAGAIAQVVSAGADTPYELEQGMRAFSERALLGTDFGWVWDEGNADALLIRELWRQLVGLADEEMEHPLSDCYCAADWLEVLEGISGSSESDVAGVLRWMERVGLAQLSVVDGEDSYRMCDWFMRALLGACAGSEDAERGGDAE